MNTSTIAFLQNINAPEIILIFLIVLLLFGAKRLPELFKSFGKSIREFKKATSEIEDDIRTAMDSEDEPVRKAKPEPKQVQSKADTETNSAEASTETKKVDNA